MPKNVLIKRVIYSLLIGVLLGIVIAEIPFLFLRETARPPKEITLVIPNGTAEQVARGEQPPTIPENMVCVVGDTMIVKTRILRIIHSIHCLFRQILRRGWRLIPKRVSRTNVPSSQVNILDWMCKKP